METNNCGDCNDALYEFKSYYVVWKRQFENFAVNFSTKV